MLEKVFGEKIADIVYHDRIGAYAVLIDGEKIAVTRTRGGKIFLPGGKIEQDETDEECLIRECMEEMGIKVSIKEFMAIGERYFYLESNNQYSHPIAHFYYCDEYEKVSEPLEKGSEYMWMNYKEAIKQLYHPHHSWAAEMIWDLAQKRRFS